jgi:8-oxo-dGTP pyrophosphatase MutT (NUDIX family)
MVCRRCAAVHYENPKILVTCLAHSNQRLAMCRRRDNPAAGLWITPGGFLELGETLQAASAREAAEEAGLIVDPGKLIPYGIASLPDLGEVYVAFRIEIPMPILKAGPECLEACMFADEDMPWDRIAFSVPEQFYRLFFQEQKAGQFSFHVSNIRGDARQLCSYPIGDPGN